MLSRRRTFVHQKRKPKLPSGYRRLRKEARSELQAELDQTIGQLHTQVREIAAKYNRSVAWVRAQLFGGSKSARFVRRERKIRLYDAYVHIKSKELNKDREVGDKYDVHEIKAKIAKERPNYKSRPRAEQEEWLKEYKADKAAAARQPRVNRKAEQQDASSTLKRVSTDLDTLRTRTGVRSFLIAVRPEVLFSMDPWVFCDKHTEEFFSMVLNKTPEQLARLLESATINGLNSLAAPPPRNAGELKKDTRERIQRGLDVILEERYPNAEETHVRMNYEQYESEIVARHQVQLIGWTFNDGIVTNPSKLGKTDRRALHAGLVSKSVYWQLVPGTETEMETATVTGKKRKRDPRSGANKKPKKKIDRRSPALRAVLESDFNQLTYRTTTAPQLSTIVEALITTSRAILHEFVSIWNEKHASICLPAEILAECLAFMPFEDRVAVSHVSRAWRHTASAFPAVWSHIVLTSRSREPGSLFLMAISRAGQLPILLDCHEGSSGTSFDDAACNTVEAHLTRVRAISWHSAARNLFVPRLVRPAPLLERLTTDPTLKLTISKNFLGGQPSRLRFLEVDYLYLPSSAPVLSTVTDLRCRVDTAVGNVEQFLHLFELMPRLEYLSLDNLASPVMHCMPPGPALATLSRINLQAFGRPPGDIAAQYVAWSTDGMQHAQLWSDHPRDALKSVALPALLRDATKIIIALSGRAQIALWDSKGRQCCFWFPSRPENPKEHIYYRYFLSCAPLEQLRSASIDCTLLASVLDRLPPNLAHLVLFVRECDSTPTVPVRNPERSFAWSSLECLASVSDRLGSLESLRLEIHPLGGSPTADDARPLLHVITPLASLNLQVMNTRGFPTGVVQDVVQDAELASVYFDL
ncbi:hypothetical protein AURDEDRAFT_166525 [Auricularia subglabra TFB-10046 SS5]|nr:hypothetical protein AURDEDRAFT_166525 [Auricularia subglabra TFB-10046 SS5]